MYPASFHNKFIHYIGVYHLGRKVFDSVHNSLGSLEQTFPEELDNFKRLFELACLLHDVGHAPFSHTGERLFLADADNPPAIYAKLIALVSDPDFSDDFDYYCNNGKVAAPHEIMSCIVALEVFKDHFSESAADSLNSHIVNKINKQRCLLHKVYYCVKIGDSTIRISISQQRLPRDLFLREAFVSLVVGIVSI